ncbi:MAG TPA: PqiC family protein [Methylomirabilota bacterium]|nr:PqiC family protein [Methylomirabilota bacterium]
MRRLPPIAMLCAVVVLAWGCASPSPHYYTLSAAATPAVPAADVSVAVGPVAVPAEVDRPQMVVRTGGNEVQLDEFHRWASPLPNAISRAIAQNLATLLGSSRVTLFPQTVSASADYRAAIEVQRFESALGEAAELDAVWTVTRGRDGKSQSGRTTAREPAADKGYDTLAAAHSRAIARLSQDLAGAVRALAQ